MNSFYIETLVQMKFNTNTIIGKPHIIATKYCDCVNG